MIGLRNSFANCWFDITLYLTLDLFVRVTAPPAALAAEDFLSKNIINY